MNINININKAVCNQLNFPLQVSATDVGDDCVDYDGVISLICSQALVMADAGLHSL